MERKVSRAHPTQGTWKRQVSRSSDFQRWILGLNKAQNEGQLSRGLVQHAEQSWKAGHTSQVQGEAWDKQVVQGAAKEKARR